ncbi:putative Rrna dimethyltransferase [Leptomonas pyrrhocoris]|uniref:rRNA adenine N(6)-methyltransferase n=1 Tax=Leptomonas pyrrhocoris TaxID=157538 RepID=A0A0M9GA48_LEPPY|nr:putative Rrna dimethyltransferase [Leptomonas pyrrhocoris]KPA85947.1 putative Rrna dimethyltransferase [Leptomonas pyrrhocoris]|eukprot:XP_015664386.1 putative Rrna dimethyltransferase [Leptomonas pyrrhocoris]
MRTRRRVLPCGHPVFPAACRCLHVGLAQTSSVLRATRAEKHWFRAAAAENRQRASRSGSSIFSRRNRPSTTTHDITSAALRGGAASSDTAASSASLALPPLRCPGGPRIKAEGIKQLYKVPHAGFLAKYDQRFMLNLKLTHQLVSYLSRTTLTTPDKVLVELGPGVGSLTRSLLTRPCVGVLGIEVDERFNPHLEQIRSYTNNTFQWVNADVLKVDELQLLSAAFPKFVKSNLRHPPGAPGERRKEGEDNSNETNSFGGDGQDDLNGGGDYEGAPLRSAQRERLLRKRQARAPYQHGEATRRGGGAEEASDWSIPSNPAFDITDQWWSSGAAKVEVIANLPFEIITELLMRYAADCARHRGIFAFGRVPVHVFTQREVAERILAPAGSVEFSRLSVLCQCFFNVRLKQTFVDQTYYPRTEVEGAMLTLEPRTVPLARGLDASTLIHFTNLLMKPGMRGATVHKSLMKFAPPELVQYMLQELRMDGAMTVLDLSVAEVTKMALLWQQFLTVSQQHQQGYQPPQQEGEAQGSRASGADLGASSSAASAQQL